MDERLFAVKLEIKMNEKPEKDERHRYREVFSCYLAVYLDSRLEVAYPITPFAHHQQYSRTRYIIRNDLPDLTNEQFNELDRRKFINHAGIATTNWDYSQREKETMFSGGLTYDRILVDAFKGVTYIEFLRQPCGFGDPPKGYDWELWLQKSKEGDFFDLLHRYSKEWDKFRAAHEIIPIPRMVMEFPEADLAKQYDTHYYITTSMFKDWLLGTE